MILLKKCKFLVIIISQCMYYGEFDTCEEWGNNMDFERIMEQAQNGGSKLRIVQELVPGKQITLAHVIASPDAIIYKKLGLDPSLDYHRSAIGILTMSPSEVSVIAGDIALKTSNVEMGFIDRFSGTLIFTGQVADVESAMQAIVKYCSEVLGFNVCEMTRT